MYGILIKLLCIRCLNKNINSSLTNRCATVELNLQRRYDSVTNKLKFKLKQSKEYNNHLTLKNNCYTNACSLLKNNYANIYK